MRLLLRDENFNLAPRMINRLIYVLRKVVCLHINLVLRTIKAIKITR